MHLIGVCRCTHCCTSSRPRRKRCRSVDRARAAPATSKAWLHRTCSSSEKTCIGKRPARARRGGRHRSRGTLASRAQRLSNGALNVPVHVLAQRWPCWPVLMVLRRRLGWRCCAAVLLPLSWLLLLHGGHGLFHLFMERAENYIKHSALHDAIHLRPALDPLQLLLQRPNLRPPPRATYSLSRAPPPRSLLAWNLQLVPWVRPIRT